MLSPVLGLGANQLQELKMNEQLLERIAKALESLAGISTDLGFRKYPGDEAEFIHIQEFNKRPWLWYPNDIKTAIGEDYLKGVVRKIVIRKKTDEQGQIQLDRNGKEIVKLNIHVQADKNYILQSGLDTFFSRGFLTALLQVVTLDEPVIINPRFGTQGEVIFCGLLDSNENNIRYELVENKHGLTLLTELEAKFPGLTEDRTQDNDAAHEQAQAFDRKAWLIAIKQLADQNSTPPERVSQLIQSRYKKQRAVELTQNELIDLHNYLQAYSEKSDVQEIPDF